MTNEKATRRYLGTLIPAALAFIGASLALKLMENAGLLPLPAVYALSVIPVALILFMFWAHWRYMNEIDEFLRSIQAKGGFAGLVVVLTVATGWGWLELAADAPALSIFWLNPLYWLVYSVAVLWLTPRDETAA